jgi:hypothetical protein
MRFLSAVLAAVVFHAAAASAQAPVTPGLPPPQVVPPEPQTQTPTPATPAPTDTPVQATPSAPVSAPVGRVFVAPVGMLFQSVRPERVADFEAVIWYLQQALQKSTNPVVRAQAAGWKIYRATEPGPNATVTYVFVLDPAVPKADYGIGAILNEAYPDRIQEIWRLYQGAVTGGGSLLNLTPSEPKEPAPIVPPAAGQPATPAPGRTPPPGTP